MPKVLKPPKVLPEIPPVPSFKEDRNQNHDPDEYRRSGTDSGLVVIFNQQSYEDDNYKFRKGTNQDVNELVLTFGRLGFNVDEKYIFNNLDRGSFLNVIRNVSQEDHTHRNCLIIVVLTHGEQHNELQTQDAPVFAYEIWEPFFNSACTSLRNKPKFFIFQACKGDNFSTSVSNAGTIVSETMFQKPLESDMLIAFSCVEGGKSARNLRKGTWFIQELCRNFSTFGGREDVVSLLLRVSKCVAYNYYHVLEDEKTLKKTVIKQMPLLMSTLSKKFYLSKSKDRNMLLNLQKQQVQVLDALNNIYNNI